MRRVRVRGRIAFLLLAALAACRQAKPPAEAQAGLESPDAEVRRNSAADLRAIDKVPDEAVPKLLIAAKNEKDPDALGSMLVTLGVSGALAARDTICAHYRDENDKVAAAASRGIGKWLEKNPEQGGCAMSSVEEVPKSDPPQQVEVKPAKKKSWTHDLR